MTDKAPTVPCPECEQTPSRGNPLGHRTTCSRVIPKKPSMTLYPLADYYDDLQADGSSGSGEAHDGE